MFGSSNSGGGGFSFGSSNNNSSSNTGGSTGFSFGNNNNSTGTANTSANSGGLFGSKPSTGFSFGSTNTGSNPANTSSGGLFGNQSNNTNATGSTGLFGNTNNNNNNNNSNTGGGLFGSSNTNTANTSSGGGLFGNTNNSSGGGLFGNSTNQANQTNSNTGGGLFGNTASTSNNSTSLFGNKPTTGSTTGGLFGNNNAASNTSTSGGLFGNSGANTNTNNTSAGGLFGSTANKPTTGGGLFGNNNATSSTGNSLFGNNNNASTNLSSTSGGLFGGNNNANNQNQQIGGGGLFGTNNNQSTNNQPSFAWTQNQNSGFNTQSSLQNNPTINALQLRQQQEQQQQNLSNYSNTIIEQLMKIKNSWDPNSPASLLNAYFYNKVPESEVLSYVKPPNVSQEEWNNAISKRPGSTFVPVKASGFEDLKKRSEAQTNHVAQSRFILKEIEAKAKDLGDKHDLDSTTRITKCKNKHEQLSKKLLVLGCKLSILKSKGYPLSPEEEILSENFNKLLKLINDPIGLGRINELWSRLSILRERSELLKARLGNALYVGQKADGSGDDLNDVYNENEAQINKVIKILQKQQVGIQFLSEILEKDDATLDTLISEKQKK